MGVAKFYASRCNFSRLQPTKAAKSRLNCCYRVLLACLVNPLNAKLNPICHLLALLEAHHIFHVSGVRVRQLKCLCKMLTKFSLSLSHARTHARTHARVVFQALSLSLCHQSDEQFVHVLSAADVARRLMLIAKRNKWQFVVKT